MDPVAAVIDVAEAEGLYTHVDAAWAGAAMICPEYRPLLGRGGRADSVVFNPHKWLGAQFECTAHFLKDPAELIRTVGLRPEYLQTLGQDEIVNFNEWSVPLGRRFRALKVWFLLRAMAWRDCASGSATTSPGPRWRPRGWPRTRRLRSPTKPVLGLFSFAHRRGNEITQRLIEAINDDGRLYLTQTMHEGRFVIRMSVGQFETTQEDVALACDAIREICGRIE